MKEPPKVPNFVWIATANLKDSHVTGGWRFFRSWAHKRQMQFHSIPQQFMALTRILPFLIFVLLASCSSPRYEYCYVPGRTAELRGGRAVAPPRAPARVKAAIAAANSLVGLPYQFGGGHSHKRSSGYDCSGAASYVLHAAGALNGPAQTSHEFQHFGRSGKGQWITVYAIKGHVFLSIAGLRFDTGWHGRNDGSGPRWSTRTRPAEGAVLRHPPGL